MDFFVQFDEIFITRKLNINLCLEEQKIREIAQCISKEKNN